MDGRKVDRYFPTALVGGVCSSAATAITCLVYARPGDLSAIAADGFAGVYVPLGLLLAALPGALVAVGLRVAWRRLRRER